MITVPPSFVDAWRLRVIALALVLAAFPGSATSQAVSSVQLSKTVTIDGLYFGADGTLYALEGFSGNRILRIDRSGQVESLPQAFDGPIHVSTDARGRVYATSYNDGAFARAGIETNSKPMVTGLNGQSGVVRGPGGAFYVATWGTADRPGTTIHRITPDGATSVFAEGGGILTAQPLALDDDGYLYVGNAVSGAIHRIDATGLVEPFVELPPLIGNRVHFGGVLYVTAPTERRVLRIDIVSRQISVLVGSGESALLDGIGEEASFVAPWGIAITPDGRELWVSDAGSRGQDQIRRIVLDM